MSSIIFDFDGTIADSFKVFLDILYEVTGTTERLPASEVARLRGMSPLHIAVEVKIKPWKIPLLVLRGRRQMRTQMNRVHAFAGMTDVIKKLSADGHELYIMSSNSVQNIQPFLKKYDMSTEFIKIYGNVGVFAKARVLKRVLRQNNLTPSDTFYIGDEVRDVVAAKHAGLRMIAVTWGYNNAEILEAQQPQYLAQRPEDIVEVFEKSRSL